jgi:hypothetical protein
VDNANIQDAQELQKLLNVQDEEISNPTSIGQKTMKFKQEGQD